MFVSVVVIDDDASVVVVVVVVAITVISWSDVFSFFLSFFLSFIRIILGGVWGSTEVLNSVTEYLGGV